MENELRLQRLFSAVFGESDDDRDADDDHSRQQRAGFQQWERVSEVKGLWLCRCFLSQQQERELLKDIESEAWFMNPEDNQAMRFGGLPSWALDLSAVISASILSFTAEDEDGWREAPLCHEILSRDPLFNQMIVNSYQPLEGIAAHVDLLRFDDGVAIVSLMSPRVMTFKPSRTSSKLEESCEFGNGIGQEVHVLLMPGDLVMMSGEARYDWTHEISAQCQVWKGTPVELGRRISVTLRWLPEEK